MLTYRGMLIVLALIMAVSGAGAAITPEQGCTVLYMTDGISFFGGNNEDYMNPLTKMWFIPGENGDYGRVYFGFEDLHAQGGMNEQGLFFDGLGIDDMCLADTEGKEEYLGNFLDRILCDCATVDCALELFEQFYTSEYWFWQFMLGDATGVSAIVEADAVHRQEGGYQVATNFLQSQVPHEQALQSDTRYRQATELFAAADEASVDLMREALDAVHAAHASKTLYSNVYDLSEQRIYLYFFHDFDNAVIIDLAGELERGFHVQSISDLFPVNATEQNWSSPIRQQRESLIASIHDPEIAGRQLEVYEGMYEMLDGWGDPASTLEVLAGEQSIFMRFPWYRQFELHPISAAEFAYVGFARSEFAVMMTVRFGFDDEGQVRYLELVMGDQATRSEKL